MKTLQAKDIPDEMFLDVLADSPATSWWRVTEALGVFPEKVVLAKARSLIKRRIIGGCPCGCQGDWYIVTDEHPFE